MGLYTITTTREEDAALLFAAGTDADAVLQNRVRQDILADLVTRYRAYKSAQYRERLEGLDATTKARVLGDLGLSE